MADLIPNEAAAGSSGLPCELRLATVVNFSATSGSTLLFDGESEATTKRYKRLYSANLSAGYRVLCAKVSGTYVILGRVY